MVLDGSKALRRAVVDVFDHPVIQRCQLHKIRNVQDRLPQKLRFVVAKRMRAAYHAESALAAQAQLETLAGELDRTHPGAAASTEPIAHRAAPATPSAGRVGGMKQRSPGTFEVARASPVQPDAW